jgi:hypothetical protein
MQTVSQDVGEVGQSVRQTGEAAGKVLSATTKLATQSEEQVDHFLADVRAA